MSPRDRTHDTIPDDAYMSRDPRIIPALLKHVTPRGDIWEPAIGEGHLAYALTAAGHSVHGSDIVNRNDAIYKELQNFFDYKDLIWPTVRSIVTNPPNSAAIDFTRHAIELMRPVSGMVCIYQRHEWNCTQESARVFDLPCYAGRITCRWRPRWFEPKPGEPEASPFHKWAWFYWDWRAVANIDAWERFA